MVQIFLAFVVAISLWVKKITDSEGVENGIDTIEGLGLLPVETDFYMEKTTRQITGVAYNGKK